jgi:hypothetical protein
VDGKRITHRAGRAERKGTTAGLLIGALCAAGLLGSAPAAQASAPQSSHVPAATSTSQRGAVDPAHGGVGDGTVIATGLALAVFLAAGGFAASGRRRGASSL